MTAPANEAPHEIEGTVEFSEVSFRLKDGKNKSFENMELDKRKLIREDRNYLNQDWKQFVSQKRLHPNSKLFWDLVKVLCEMDLCEEVVKRFENWKLKQITQKPVNNNNKKRSHAEISGRPNGNGHNGHQNHNRTQNKRSKVTLTGETLSDEYVLDTHE
jgi:hypothetical protein